MNSSRSPMETSPPRMEPLARLPIFFALAGRRVVLAGGSPAAAWKAELLSAAGAAVEVLTHSPSEELLAIAATPSEGKITIRRRAWQPEDLVGAAVAVGAFDDDGEARQFAEATRSAGVPVN